MERNYGFNAQQTNNLMLISRKYDVHFHFAASELRFRENIGLLSNPAIPFEEGIAIIPNSPQPVLGLNMRFSPGDPVVYYVYEIASAISTHLNEGYPERTLDHFIKRNYFVTYDDIKYKISPQANLLIQHGRRNEFYASTTTRNSHLQN